MYGYGYKYTASGSIGSNVNQLTDEYKAIIAQLTGSEPSLVIKVAQNQFIKTLVDSGVFAKLSCIIPYAWGMPTTADNLIWANTPTRKAVLSATAPTYVAGAGFTGNGSSSYIDTTFNPSTDGSGKFTQNDATSAWWFSNVRTGVGDRGCGLAISANGTLIMPFISASTGYFRMNSATGTFSSTSNNHLFSLIRKSSTTVNSARDRTLSTDITRASTGVSNGSMYSLAINSGSGILAGSYMADTIGLEFHGAQLSAAEIAIICDAWDMLMLAVQSSIAILDYDAAGNSIDGTKFSITNPNTTKIAFSQNNAIIMDELGYNGALWADILTSVAEVNYGTFKFDIANIAPISVSGYSMAGIYKNNTNYAAIFPDYQGTRNLMFRVAGTGFTTYNVNTGLEDIAKVRIIKTATNAIILYAYVNDAWVKIGNTTQSFFGNAKFFMASDGVNLSRTYVNDILITRGAQ